MPRTGAIFSGPGAFVGGCQAGVVWIQPVAVRRSQGQEHRVVPLNTGRVGDLSQMLVEELSTLGSEKNPAAVSESYAPSSGSLGSTTPVGAIGPACVGGTVGAGSASVVDGSVSSSMSWSSMSWSLKAPTHCRRRSGRAAMLRRQLRRSTPQTTTGITGTRPVARPGRRRRQQVDLRRVPLEVIGHPPTGSLSGRRSRTPPFRIGNANSRRSQLQRSGPGSARPPGRRRHRIRGPRGT